VWTGLDNSFDKCRVKNVGDEGSDQIMQRDGCFYIERIHVIHLRISKLPKDRYLGRNSGLEGSRGRVIENILAGKAEFRERFPQPRGPRNEFWANGYEKAG